MTNTIPVLIPLADGHSLSAKVLSGLLKQVTEVRVYAVSRPANLGSRRVSEALSRNSLISSVTPIIDDPVFVMMDSDIVLDSTDVLSNACSQLLKLSENIASLHIKTIPYVTPRHFDIGCMVVRKRYSDIMVFSTNEKGTECLCESWSTRLRENGLSQVWFNHNQ